MSNETESVSDLLKIFDRAARGEAPAAKQPHASTATVLEAEEAYAESALALFERAAKAMGGVATPLVRSEPAQEVAAAAPMPKTGNAMDVLMARITGAGITAGPQGQDLRAYVEQAIKAKAAEFTGWAGLPKGQTPISYAYASVNWDAAYRRGVFRGVRK